MRPWFIVVLLFACIYAIDTNVHYRVHVSFFGVHPVPVVTMYVGSQSRQMNLILEFCRPVHLDARNLTDAQKTMKTFFYGHPSAYIEANRNRRIHYSDTFHESSIPGASKIKLYSEGASRIFHADIIGSYREMPPIIKSAISPARPPAALSYISRGYHYVSGLIRVDGAFFLDPESLVWQGFDGFVLEHTQLNLISRHATVKPITSQIDPLRIPCNVALLRSNTTKNIARHEDFCTFEVIWPVTGETYILTFNLRSTISYLPERIYRHYYSKNERRADVDNYFAVEVGKTGEVLVLPPVLENMESYARERSAGLTPVITLGRDAIFFYRNIFGLQVRPSRELLIAPPYPYHTSTLSKPKSTTAVMISSIVHVTIFGMSLVAHYIFRGPTTNLLTRIRSYNSYDKWEMRIETYFQVITNVLLMVSIIMALFASWHAHTFIFISGIVGAVVHLILLTGVIVLDPVPFLMRLGIHPYYPKRSKINARTVMMKPAEELPRILTNPMHSFRRRRTVFSESQVDTIPLMSHEPDTSTEKKEEASIYDTASLNVFWVDDIPYVYYNSTTLDFIRAMINVNSTIFVMLLFSMSYEFKFAFFSAIMMTQFMAVSSVVYVAISAILLRFYTYVRRSYNRPIVGATIIYGACLFLYYMIIGNMFLVQQLVEANSFYDNGTVPVEFMILINLSGIIYAAFTIFNHIEDLNENAPRIQFGKQEQSIQISILSSHVNNL